ncbi:MAG: nucleoside deaminase [Deltaproteobacteria bacterium]|nr:nucleoside deaminase [Deltaproteobacteria bacterium]
MSEGDYFSTPEWLSSLVAWDRPGFTPQLLMKTAIDVAIASAKNGGGPFGAVLADASGKIVEIGWNYVVKSHDSTRHAETHCIRRAQNLLNTHDLGAPGLPELALYSSCSPCVHCFGVIYWSGLKKVLAAATKEDAEAAGFDEGPLTPDMWAAAKERKGIEYTPCFCRDQQALEPFRVFAALNGKLY